MKIALLNLPFDNNYGGNLQRYALMKVLREMGYDVTYLFLKFSPQNPPLQIQIYKSIVYAIRFLVGKRSWQWTSVVTPKQLYEKKCISASSFMDKYVPHTEAIYDLKDLYKHTEFDIFLVGSDQVWRKSIAKHYLSTMFFDYLPESKKKVAYSVSLGSEQNEYTKEEIDKFAKLYAKFTAVSVREESALNLFEDYKWTSPRAFRTLDPTLLLDKQDYINLIEAANTFPSKGNLFCYILDPSKEKESTIARFMDEKGLKPYSFGINENSSSSIEQWLRSFMDADFVVTDSFHGFVFSIIFNKPFYLFKNEFRGNARFDSLCQILGVDLDRTEQNWVRVNQRRNQEIVNSIGFLRSALQ